MVARCVGVRVRPFTIGFRPAPARRVDASHTAWARSLLLRGGYVGFEGKKYSDRLHSYTGQSPLARLAVITSGPAANILFAISVFAMLLALFGTAGFRPIASTVAAGSAVDRGGFLAGDQELMMK